MVYLVVLQCILDINFCSLGGPIWVMVAMYGNEQIGLVKSGI